MNNIRIVQHTLALTKKIRNTVAILCLGIALGVLAKFLDTTPINMLPFMFIYLDISNFLGRFTIWLLLALCISIYSSTPVRAGINVFAFFLGMVASYYLYSNYIAGFFPKSYAFIWFGCTALSPFLAFLCWYAKGKGRPALILSALILAVLFNTTFVYGWGYLETYSTLELVVFIIGFIVLRANTLKDSVQMGIIGILFAVLLNVIFPFHFG